MKLCYPNCRRQSLNETSTMHCGKYYAGIHRLTRAELHKSDVNEPNCLKLLLSHCLPFDLYH